MTRLSITTLTRNLQDRAYYEHLWRTISAGKVWHGELINRHKDGTHYTEEMSITPVRDASGAITNFIAIKQDVTERKAAEKARAFLASIVESSDTVIIGTPDGIVSSWNRGAETLFGYRAGEMEGKPLSILVPPENLEHFRHVQEKLRRGETVAPFEAPAVGKGGKRVETSMALSAIKNTAGEVTATAAIIRDLRREEARAGTDRVQPEGQCRRDREGPSCPGRREAARTIVLFGA